MALRKHRIWVALAGLSVAASGCGLVGGFQSISVDASGAGGAGGAASGTYECVWVKGFAGNNQQGLGGLALDENGNVWLTGGYKGTLIIDADHTLGDGNDPDDYNVFVIKLGAETGAHAFSKGYGDDSEQIGASIAAKGSGVFVTGTTVGKINFGCPEDPSENTATKNVFMAELAADGQCVSEAGMFGDPVERRNPRATVVGTDMVVAAVEAATTKHLLLQNNGPTIQPSRKPQGVHVQAPSADVVPYAGLSLGNKLFLVGDFDVSANLGGAPLPGDPDPSAFVAAFDPAKLTEALWGRGFGSTNEQSARALASDGTSTLFVTGYFQGQIGFTPGGELLTSAGDRDVFVAALGAGDGAPRWQARFGGAATQTGNAIAYDAGGKAVLVSGEFLGALAFGDRLLGNIEADVHSFLARLDADSGAPRFATSFGGPGKCQILAMAVRDGSVFIAGNYTGLLDLGCPGAPIEAKTGIRVFVAKLEPKGF